MPVKPDRAPLADAPAAAAWRFSIVDMISTWDFADADKLAPARGRDRAAHRRAEAALRARRRAGDLRQRQPRPLALGVPRARPPLGRGERRRRRDREAPAAAATTTTRCSKPKHSAFYATPLDLLLRHLRVTRLLSPASPATSASSMSAAEARMRDYEVDRPGRLRRRADAGAQRARAAPPRARRTASRRRRRRGCACRRSRRDAPTSAGASSVAAERAVLRLGELPGVLARGEQLLAEAFRRAIAARVVAAQEHAGLPARIAPRLDDRRRPVAFAGVVSTSDMAGSFFARSAAFERSERQLDRNHLGRRSG